MTKWVYSFGAGHNEGRADMKNLLGGKGANLAEMASIGLPVPPGFTITTEVCTAFHENNRQYPGDLKGQVDTALALIEKAVGRSFGDQAHPLLVSVRSGARVSMPGMMDTVLNLGLNDVTVEGLAAAADDPRFAWDSYRRFIQMYGSVVLGVDHHRFEEIIEHAKLDADVIEDTALTADRTGSQRGRRLQGHGRSRKPASRSRRTRRSSCGAPIGAVFGSWMNPRAITYRRLHDIPAEWGTAVNVQAMVYGNMGDDCATGVCFTRDPSTGENMFYGEYLVNAQGEDVVAGIRTPQPLSKAVAKPGEMPLEAAMPDAYARTDGSAREAGRALQATCRTSSSRSSSTSCTCCRPATASAPPRPALRMAVDMAREGLIDEAEAVMRVNPSSLDQLLHPMLDPKAPRTLLGQGPARQPRRGVAASWCSPPTKPRCRAAKGEAVILVRIETSPEDIHGMHAAQGILTTRGGMTSHAAVVARGMGRPCVAGAGGISVDYNSQMLAAGGKIRPRRRDDHPRRRDRRGLRRLRRHDRAGDVGRFRHADGVGRQAPPHGRARQRRNAAGRRNRAQVRRRGHRPVPHRAHVLRPGAHPRGAADDHLEQRGRAAAPRWPVCCRSSARISASCSPSWPGCR